MTAAMAPVTAVPAAAPTPTGGTGAQPRAQGTEPCPHCGTSLALDQRYCLECGAPRTYLSGMLLDRMRPSAAAQAAPGQPAQSPMPGGATGVLPPPPPGSSTWQRGNVLTLIAGIGVLLLAMGVGVLIGRSGGSSSAGAAPQVITVGGAATGAANTTPTPTTPEASSAAKAGAVAGAAAAAKHKAKEAGVGAVPGKPAPPTVLKNLRTGSGQSYEQKSKNLPNVVSTG